MHRQAVIFATALVFAAAPAAFAQKPETSPGHGEINSRCVRCHTQARILNADPAQLPGIVDRMSAKDPALFGDVDKAELVRALGQILEDPKVAASRAAWDAAVADGAKVFADAALGTTGKSCSSCHRPEDLRGTAQRYPAFDAKLGRLVSLQERLRTMIVGKLGGKELPLGDARTVALEAYLNSLE